VRNNKIAANTTSAGFNMGSESSRKTTAEKLKPFSKHYLAIAKEHEDKVRQQKVLKQR
jgi:hypothetical protein